MESLGMYCRRLGSRGEAGALSVRRRCTNHRRKVHRPHCSQWSDIRHGFRRYGTACYLPGGDPSVWLRSGEGSHAGSLTEKVLPPDSRTDSLNSSCTEVTPTTYER